MWQIIQIKHIVNLCCNTAISAIFIFSIGMTGFSIPKTVYAQTANFHPCNAQPALPICRYGYGRRIAVKRWNAKPAPLDPDATPKAKLTTNNPEKEIKDLKAVSAIVTDTTTNKVLFARDAKQVMPIASITKLMTALVIADSKLAWDEKITITAADNNLPSDLPSRLKIGASLTRYELLSIAITASENSAAHALARTYPGGIDAFVAMMNYKAAVLGMNHTIFKDVTGLASGNKSTAKDLVKLVVAAAKKPLIQEFASDDQQKVNGKIFNNTSMLVGRNGWDILLSKTGTTSHAGDCLAMLFKLNGHKMAMIILNSQGLSGSRYGDAVRMRRIVSYNLASD